MNARELIEKAIESKDRRLIARALTVIEEGKYLEVADYLFGEPRAHVVGITGSPGVGKSSLISKLIQFLRKKGKSVAVIAIDPASPLSGAALMGDRVRVKVLDDATFFRSLSTPPEQALPLHAVLMIEFLDRVGYDYIIIETPGVGQVNVDVVRIAHTTVVVVQPAAGDDIQVIKSGIMEIGDIYVVNKADMPHAEVTALQLESTLRGCKRDDWEVKILKTCAFSGAGVKDLVDALEERLELLMKSGEFHRKVVERRWFIVERMVLDSLLKTVNNVLENFKAKIDMRKINPIALGRELSERIVNEYLCK